MTAMVLMPSSLIFATFKIQCQWRGMFKDASFEKEKMLILPSVAYVFLLWEAVKH